MQPACCYRNSHSSIEKVVGAKNHVRWRLILFTLLRWLVNHRFSQAGKTTHLYIPPKTTLECLHEGKHSFCGGELPFIQQLTTWFCCHGFNSFVKYISWHLKNTWYKQYYSVLLGTSQWLYYETCLAACMPFYILLMQTCFFSHHKCSWVGAIFPWQCQSRSQWCHPCQWTERKVWF